MNMKFSTWIILGITVIASLFIVSLIRQIDSIEQKLSNLTNENINQINEIAELEETIEVLENDILNYKETNTNLTELNDELFNELQNYSYRRKREVEEYDFNDYYDSEESSSYNSSSTSSISSSTSNKSIEKTYHNGGYVIAPTFSNLEKLLSISDYSFDDFLIKHGYKKESGEVYMHQKSGCCISIRRSNGELQLIYTGNISSDILSTMSKNNISSSPYGNFRRFEYQQDGKKYTLNYKSNYQSTQIVVQY